MLRAMGDLPSAIRHLRLCASMVDPWPEVGAYKGEVGITIINVVMNVVISPNLLILLGSPAFRGKRD